MNLLIRRLALAVQAWRCLLYGHAWGAEQKQWEDAGYPVHVETWRECQRPECGAYELLWSVYWPPVHANCRGTLP